MVATLLVAAIVAGCVGDDDHPAPVAASMEEKFPSESLSDWVSYAQQVSVLTVLSEAQVPPPDEVWQRKEGYIGRIVTVRIDHDLWVAPGATPVHGEQQMLDWGWLLKGERLTPFSKAMLQPGEQYVVPLASSRGKLGSISVSAIRISGASVAADVVSDQAWIRELGGQSLRQLEASLRAAVPDPVAVRFAHMDPADRVEAVRAARSGEPSSPTSGP